MTLMEIQNLLDTPKYAFLRTNWQLNTYLIMLTLGGSYAYGTNTDTSDIDIRGCVLNTKRQILTGESFEQFTDNATDTVIYSFNKIIPLLLNCNPNTIELLGNKREHYLYLHPIGQEIIEHTDLFLSRRAIHSFGGYATAQLRRLENKSNRLNSQPENEKHILNTITYASDIFREKYFDYPEDSIKLYVDKSNREECDSEIFMDVTLKHYPLRDYSDMMGEMKNIVTSYNKIGERNKKAILHGKIGKHMMHLVRLYFMCFDILEKKQVITYREAEHDFLVDIRNGKYLDSNSQPIPEFYELINDLDRRFNYAKENTDLPEKPNYKAVAEFVESVNERVVKDEIE